MKVLIIEDDEFKSRWLAEAVQGCLHDAELLTAKSVNSGLAALIELKPEILLLDMSLTTFDVGPDEHGGRPQNFGGLEILRQMARLDLRVPTVVITQHEKFKSGLKELQIDALYDELKSDFGEIFQGLVYYNSSQGGWKQVLARILRQIVRKIKVGNRG